MHLKISNMSLSCVGNIVRKEKSLECPHQMPDSVCRTFHTLARKLHSPRQEHPNRVSRLSTVAQDSLVETKTTPESADATDLASMLADLKALPVQAACRTLGSNLLGASSHLNLLHTSLSIPGERGEGEDTPWLASFYAAMPSFPGPQHWHEHIALLCYARRLGIHKIHSTVLIAQLTNMQIAGLIPQERTFNLVSRLMYSRVLRCQSPFRPGNFSTARISDL